MSDLDLFLAELTAYQSAGRGTFTLDPARQRELLGRFGLLESELGFLKLAQGAYLSGSSHLHWAADATSLSCSFAPTQAPRQPLWEGDDLALGLLCLSQEYGLDWEWSHGTQRVQGKAQQHHFQESTGSGPEETAPILKLRIQQLKKSWWRRSWTARVEKLLSKRLTYMPLEIDWNGQPMQRSPRLSARAEALVYSRPDEAGDLWLPLQSACQQRLTRCGDIQGPEALEAASPLELGGRLGHRGWAILATTNSSRSETTFVLHGVSLTQESNLLDRPGIVAVVSAAGLHPALGGLDLNHDQTFRERLQSLKGEVRWLDSINHSGH